MKKSNILLTSIVIVFSIVIVGIVYMPMLMGLEAYSIETGSMEPAVPKGSMVYIRRYNNFEDYRIGDIVTFKDTTGTKNFTHRIVGINTLSESFTTKGDANNDVDLKPTGYLYAVGKVEVTIPYVGYVAVFLRNTVVKIIIALIYIAWIAIEIELFRTKRKKRYE